MLRRAVEVSLAADRTVVLPRGLLQVNAEPDTFCDMDGANIFDDTRSVSRRLDSLADPELDHNGGAAAGHRCVLSRQLHVVLSRAAGRRV